VGELCPGCGSVLELAGSLDELVGFRVGSPSADAGRDPFDVAVSVALQAPDAR
jgi:hypothetical protein